MIESAIKTIAPADGELWTAIGTIILLLTAIVLIWQLRAIRKAAALEGFNVLANLLNQPDLRKARGLLYEMYENLQRSEVYEKINDAIEINDAIDRNIVLLDQMGTLINQGLIPERVPLEMYWDVVIKTWDAAYEHWIVPARDRKAIHEKGSVYHRLPIHVWIKRAWGFTTHSLRRLIAAIIYRNDALNDFEFFRRPMPIFGEYSATHCENFERLVLRAERYCIKRGLNRPKRIGLDGAAPKVKSEARSNDPRFCYKCGGALDRVESAKGRAQFVCSGCKTPTYLNPRPCVTALIFKVKKILIFKVKKILLVKRAIDPGKGKWDLPGGFMENDEKPCDALKREIKEELGVEVLPENEEAPDFFVDQ